MRVLSLESRRAKEMEELLRKQGFDAFVAPSVREVSLEENPAAIEFGRHLLESRYDALICLTGVGVRRLLDLLEQRYWRDSLIAAIAGITTIARGPKPSAALRQAGVTPTVVVKEPATYAEVLEVVTARPEHRIAVQEYGRPDERLLSGLTRLGRDVTPVPVYQWQLPEDVTPLKEAVRQLAAGEFDAALFTSSIQLDHLLQVAAEQNLESGVRAALGRIVIASIGPTMSETLRAQQLPVSLEPSSPKMGILIHEFTALMNSSAAH